MKPSRDAILERVTRRMRELLPGIDGTLQESQGLLGQGIGIDSVEALQLVAAMEAEFGLTVRDDELLPEHFETVGSFVSFIEQKLG